MQENFTVDCVTSARWKPVLDCHRKRDLSATLSSYTAAWHHPTLPGSKSHWTQWNLHQSQPAWHWAVGAAILQYGDLGTSSSYIQWVYSRVNECKKASPPFASKQPCPGWEPGAFSPPPQLTSVAPKVQSLKLRFPLPLPLPAAVKNTRPKTQNVSVRLLSQPPSPQPHHKTQPIIPTGKLGPPAVPSSPPCQRVCLDVVFPPVGNPSFSFPFSTIVSPQEYRNSWLPACS